MNRNLFMAFLLLLMVATPVLAEGETDKASSLSVKAKASVSYISDADFDSGGSSSVTALRTSFSVGDFSIGYEGRDYGWSDKSSLAFSSGDSDPWDTLHRFSLGYTHKGMINDQWGYTGAVTLTSAFENQMDDSYGTAIRGGIMYLYDENLQFMFGARLFKNHIRSSFMPFLGLSYKRLAEDGTGAFMTLGAPGSEVGYVFSEESKIRLNFGVDGRTYRLSDDSTVVESGYMETSAMQLGFYYDWNPTKAFSLTVGPEYSFNREMKFFDDNGDRVGDIEKQDAAAGFRLEFGYKF